MNVDEVRPGDTITLSVRCVWRGMRQNGDVSTIVTAVDETGGRHRIRYLDRAPR